MNPRLLAAGLFAALLLPASPRAEEDPEREKPRPPAPAKRERPRPEAEPAPERPAPPRARPGSPAPREHLAPARPGHPRKRPWIGVSTHQIEPALREHLEIPDGFGIAVYEVMPESPAAAAGLRPNDVLVRFEDQRLISPDHLSLLVRTKEKGDRVSLTLVRRGREETVEVVLGEAEENLFGPFPPEAHPGHVIPPWHQRMMREQDEMLRRQQDYWRDWMERHEPRASGPRPEPGVDHAERHGDSAGPEARRGGPPRLRVEPGFPLRVFGSEGVLKIDNEAGELTLTRKGEDHQLVIQDQNGKIVYDGPFDPEKGVEALPEEARRQLEAMKLGNLEIRLPERPEANPEKTQGRYAEPEEESGRTGEFL